MGCCVSSGSREDLGKPLEYDPDFHGPNKTRSCTDIPFLIIFLAFIGCWAGIAIFAFRNGDPNTLLVPKDSAGSRCGLDDHVKNQKYLFFFDLTKCLDPRTPFTGCRTKQVCVEKCPTENFIWDTDKNYTKLICDYNINPKSASEGQSYIDQGLCAKWYFESTAFEYRCIPILDKNFIDEHFNETSMTTENVQQVIKNLKLFSNAEQIGQNIVDDLVTTWWKIVIGIVIAVVCCMIYILIMRWIAAVMVWLSMIGVVALLSFGVYFTAIKFVFYRDHPVQDDSYLTNKDTWLVLLIIVSILLSIILLVLIFLRKRIILAIALVKEGSKAVGSVTSVLFFPLFPWILHIGVIAFAVTTGLFLSTSGSPIYRIRNMTEACAPVCGLLKENDKCVPDNFRTVCANRPECVTTQCKFIAMDNPVFYPYLQVINVFGFLWLSFFVTDLGHMILASVFATWYWTFQKSRLPFFAVTEATCRVLRYHIGTLAFGSLIITICRMIRLVLEYIDRNLKKYDNPVTRGILCCLKCCFWCLEKCLKFINRNAYIMCAIHGKNFCSSAKDAFSLLLRNIVRVFVLDKVTDFLFFLGRVLVTAGVGAIAYVFFATDLIGIDNDNINYPLVPVITIVIFTFIIAGIFFSVYQMAVDTLFLCFLEDCERNDGTAEKPYYMSKNLMKILGRKNKLE